MDEKEKITTNEQKKFLVPRILFINEKPSVSREYAHVLGIKETEKHDGYIEGYSDYLGCNIWITWCVGHLVSMSYPEKYDIKYKKWNMDDLPFLPTDYKYEVIENVKKQFSVVKKLLNSVNGTIYYAGDSGREGIYIQALVRAMSGHNSNTEEKVVWIDSYTDREIKRGIQDAKPISEYNHLISAAYARAKEDYAVGINFSRALSCKYGYDFNKMIASDKWTTIAVGRVMTCVLGMIVEKEREIRNFTETPFYKIEADTQKGITLEWKADEKSAYYESPALYNESGFKEKANAEYLIKNLQINPELTVIDVKVTEEKKAAPLLYNLAEIQFDCSKKYKISPDQTLAIIQSLYEKKMVTYPRTDARVLSTAVAQEIGINLNGLVKLGYKKDRIMDIAQNGWHKDIAKTKYVDDSKITDHYAIIPTGNINDINNLNDLELNIYHDIIDRFLCIFYPKAVYEKGEVVMENAINERFYGAVKTLKEPGYLVVYDESENVSENICKKISKGTVFAVTYQIKEGKTTAPKRYTSGSMIIAMENAGKMIDDEVLREQIKGSGIGTSATRAETLKKLVKIGYLSLNTKTQVLTPSFIGESVYDIVQDCCPEMLKPNMTAQWEQGLSNIENATVTETEYLNEMENYIRQEVEKIKSGSNIHYSQKAQEKKASPKTEEIICPLCKKGHILESKKAYGCSDYKNGCKFTVWKEISGKQISWANVKKLAETNKTSIIKGFKKKDGSGTFDAALKLQDGKVLFCFD